MNLLSKAGWTVLASLLSLPLAAADTSVTLSVPDMGCAACPTSVKRVLTRIDGVKAVDVRADVLEAVVSYDSSKTTLGDLLDMVALVGYPATLKH